MTEQHSNTVIQEGTAITGNLLNGTNVEIRGYIEGDVSAKNIVIAKTGKLYGTLQADTATVSGILQGLAKVKHLLSIADSGSVHGKVEYGQLAMASGGALSAELRNVPPELTGDFMLNVARGGSVQLTLADLNALDPDDAAEDLVFTVSNIKNGFITLASTPGTAATKFTQADLCNGNVSFNHDNSTMDAASFQVVVADASGATSGAAKTVSVAIT